MKTIVQSIRRLRSRRLHSRPLFWGALLIVAIAAALWATSGTSTRQFRDANGRVIPGSIAEMESLRINGISERVWFRGISVHNPVLILIHGGPGATESPLFRYYDSALETRFLVVYWSERGAGRSYHLLHPPRDLRLESYVRDLGTLISIVKARFHVSKVALAGHSWGTVIGTMYAHDNPEDVSVYVGIGQVGDEPEDERVGYEWALSRARARGNRDAIADLTHIGPPPHSEAEMRVERRWVDAFGGSFYGNKLNQSALIRAALSTSEMSWVDLIYFGFGIHYSMEHVWPHFRTVRLDECCRSFSVPVIMMEGRQDWQVPAVVAQKYFNEISAPVKKLIWFEHAAHNLPFEEPQAFVREMVQVVLPLASPAQARSQAPHQARQ